MREIKFKVWDANMRKMHSDATLHAIYVAARFPNSNARAIESLDERWGDCIWLQYTGLKDKNGVEGYHKDVVQMGPFLFTIEWDDKAAKFYLASINKIDGMKYSLANRLAKHEVIGNVYENPELLTEP